VNYQFKRTREKIKKNLMKGSIATTSGSAGTGRGLFWVFCEETNTEISSLRGRKKETRSQNGGQTREKEAFSRKKK